MKEVGRTRRVPLLFNDDELAAIDDYQFDTRTQTRAEAIRELIRLGLRMHKLRSDSE